MTDDLLIDVMIDDEVITGMRAKGRILSDTEAVMADGRPLKKVNGKWVYRPK